MKQGRKYFFLFLALLCQAVTATAQTDSSFQQKIPTDTITDKITIGNIDIAGNKKTKDVIILREIPFKTGDQFPMKVLLEKFADGKKQLLNTRLFNAVIVAADHFEGQVVHVKIIVRERWYFFPVPYFSFVDRNLNQWLVEHHASLKRVNYGAKLYYNNTTGRNDNLKLKVTNGYTKQLSLNYDRLYFDKKMKWGGKFFMDAGKNKEVNYATENNKQAFYKDENVFTRKFLKTYLEVSYRRAIKARHSFGIGFTQETVADTVTRLNPDYFSNGKNRLSFPELRYTMDYYDVNYIPYPTKGYIVQLNFFKKGVNKNMNSWEWQAKGSAYWPVAPKTFLTLTLIGQLKLPFHQPYYNKRVLGYGDSYLQGYEYYVVDGVAGGIAKTTLSRELANFSINLFGKNGKKGIRIPFRIFGKIYGNTGYVHNPQPNNNSLTNKMLYSGGFGIDILTLYDVTFKLEYSFNAIGENGLFLHQNSFF